jgi:cell division protein FtsB
MSLDNLSAADQKKLTEFIDQGVATLQEIKDRRESLRDLAKDLAEQWDVKPAVLTKAASAAFKESLQASKDEIDQVEAVLQYANRA